MARVNIEERAAAAAKKVAREMNWTRAEAVGRLYFFWHDSQELEQTTCTKDDIAMWMDLSEVDNAALSSCMVRAGFLREIDGATFEIVGNAKHIENLRQRREAAAIGGIRSGEVRAMKAATKASAPTEIEANASTVRSNQTQASDEPSSLQFSAVQFSAKEKESVSIAHAREGEGPGGNPRGTGHQPGQGEPPCPDPDKQGTSQQIRECEEIWIETLRVLEVGRTAILRHEKMAILEAIKRLGFKSAMHALCGYRFEPSTPTYDPKKHVRIQRVFAHDLFEKWINLACQHKEKQRQKARVA